MATDAEAPCWNGLSAEALAVLAGHRSLVRRRVAILGALAILAIAAFCADLFTGPASLPVGEVARELLFAGSGTPSVGMIVWGVRMPQGVMALLVGMSLALAGAELQTVLGNPLASPFTTGAASAASFGASLAIVSGVTLLGVPQDWLVSVSAFVFTLGTALLIWAMSRLQNAAADRLVLLGIGLTFAFQALTSIVQFFASATALQQIVFWTMGSLAQASWDQVRIVGIVVVLVLPLSLNAAWRLTALSLGDDRAGSFGVDVTRLRLGALLRVSLLTATAMCFVGTIGFVGLVAPHIARLLLGGDSRFLLPGALLTGAGVMSLASVIGKLAIPGALLPIGVVTAVIGLPIFFLLVLRRRELG